MAELIQFNCPACGTLLRLPLAMAARQGPCPNCDREIVAPDPYRGIGAYQIPAPPPPKEIEPFRPFAEPHVPQEPVTIRPEEIPVRSPEPSAVQSPACTRRLRHILIPSCLASLLIGGVWGYALGVLLPQRSSTVPSAPAPAALVLPVEKPEPPTPEPKPPEVPPVPTPVPVPEPVLVKPAVEDPPAEKPLEPAKVSAAAEASLKAFLEAPDWAARASYVLYPEKIRSAMEAYSREVPDGPTPYRSVSVQQSYTDEKTGNTSFIFNVISPKSPTDIPVAVKETSGGWLVDWQAFVEFRDGLFQKFVEGPVDKTGRFHLAVALPPADRAANTENEHFSSFLLQSPVSKVQQLAFVKKTSEAYGIFQAATQGGRVFTPVLEVAKRKTSDGTSYFEVTKVLATDWLPE